jgi:hypothetical protein
LRKLGIRLLRRIFRAKTEEIKAGWRKLHNEELHNFGFSLNVRLIKSMRMRWEAWTEREMSNM